MKYIVYIYKKPKWRDPYFTEIVNILLLPSQVAFSILQFMLF